MTTASSSYTRQSSCHLQLTSRVLLAIRCYIKGDSKILFPRRCVCNIEYMILSSYQGLIHSSFPAKLHAHALAHTHAHAHNTTHTTHHTPNTHYTTLHNQHTQHTHNTKHTVFAHVMGCIVPPCDIGHHFVWLGFCLMRHCIANNNMMSAGGVTTLSSWKEMNFYSRCEKIPEVNRLCPRELFRCRIFSPQFKYDRN